MSNDIACFSLGALLTLLLILSYETTRERENRISFNFNNQSFVRVHKVFGHEMVELLRRTNETFDSWSRMIIIVRYKSSAGASQAAREDESLLESPLRKELQPRIGVNIISKKYIQDNEPFIVREIEGRLRDSHQPHMELCVDRYYAKPENDIFRLLDGNYVMRITYCEYYPKWMWNDAMNHVKIPHLLDAMRKVSFLDVSRAFASGIGLI